MTLIGWGLVFIFLAYSSEIRTGGEQAAVLAAEKWGQLSVAHSLVTRCFVWG